MSIVRITFGGHFQTHLAVGRLQCAITGKAQCIDNSPPDGGSYSSVSICCLPYYINRNFSLLLWKQKKTMLM